MRVATCSVLYVVVSIASTDDDRLNEIGDPDVPKHKPSVDD